MITNLFSILLIYLGSFLIFIPIQLTNGMEVEDESLSSAEKSSPKKQELVCDKNSSTSPRGSKRKQSKDTQANSPKKDSSSCRKKRGRRTPGIPSPKVQEPPSSEKQNDTQTNIKKAKKEKVNLLLPFIETSSGDSEKEIREPEQLKYSYKGKPYLLMFISDSQKIVYCPQFGNRLTVISTSKLTLKAIALYKSP